MNAAATASRTLVAAKMLQQLDAALGRPVRVSTLAVLKDVDWNRAALLAGHRRGVPSVLTRAAVVALAESRESVRVAS